MLLLQNNFLCNPSGTTRPDALARASNGSIVAGNPNDVAPLQMQKQADLTVALNTIARIEQRLSFAFYLIVLYKLVIQVEIELLRKK